MRQAPFDPRQQPQVYINQSHQVYYQPSPQPPQMHYQQGQSLQAPPQLQMPKVAQHHSHAPQPHRQEVQGSVHFQEGQEPFHSHPPPTRIHQYEQDDQDDELDEHEQQGEEGEGYGSQDEMQMQNQQVIMFWQHKFYTIFQRFQIIHDKVDWLRTQFYGLNNELKAVDSEAEWNDAKQHHDDFMEHLQEFSQELAGTMNENACLLEQRQVEGEDSGTWKQRYYELFESFKSMEQELNDVNEGKSQQGVDQQFMENYRLLEREYTKVCKELEETKKEDQDPVYECRQKLEYTLQEAEKYKEMLDQLHEENQQLNSEMENLKNTNANLQQRAERNSGPTEEDYAEFKRAMEEKEYEMNQLVSQLNQYEEKFNYMNQTHQNKMAYSESIEEQLEAKNMEVSELRNKVVESESRSKVIQQSIQEYQRMIKNKNIEIQDKEDQIHRMKKQIITLGGKKNNMQAESMRKQFDNRVRKIEQEYEEKLSVLKRKMKQKQQQVEHASLTQIKLESQEKKNKMLIDEIHSISNELSDRERSLSEMKKISYEYEKLKNIEYQYQMIFQEREHLNASLLQKNYDIDNLQGKVNEFEAKIRDLSDKTFSTNSKSFIHEIQELNNLIQMKEGEANKYKSSLAIKENYILELENELEKTKNILVGNQKNYEREKDNLSDMIKHLERRNSDFQKKMRQLEHQYGSEMRKNLEEEIKSLRYQNQTRQEIIVRLEGEELQLRSRITHYQRIRASHNSDVEDLAARIKQSEASKTDMIRKIQTSYRSIKKRQKENQELIENQMILKQKVSTLETKIQESEKLILEKERIIEQFQGQLNKANTRLSYITGEHDQLRLRRRDQTDLFMKQSDGLKKKLFELEQKNPQNKEKSNKSIEYGKIQNELIQQLTEEKQFLKSELATALQELGHLPDFSKKQNTSHRKSRASQGIDYIQKRLFDFNSKLDKMIIRNQELNVNEQGSRGFGSNIENWSQGFQGNSSGKSYEQQIKLLKNQLQELRKYCARLEVEAEGQNTRINPKHEIVFMEQQKTYNDKIQFYKSQIGTLENRVSSLIEVNTILKERVDALLRGDSSTSAASLYKQQLVLAEETISSLNIKIRKLQEENRNFKLNNNETTTKISRQYEDKIFDCENKIFTLERRINNLEMEKSKVDNDRAGLSRNLHICESELQSLKMSSKKSGESLEKANKDLNQQAMKLENQMSEMLSRVRMLQSDNQRLIQALNSQQQIFMSPFKNSSYINSPKMGSPIKFER